MPHQLSGVARTLVMTLRVRAEEHLRPDGLFRDEQAAAWYAQLPHYADLDEWYNAGFAVATAVRTALYDQLVTDFIHDHPAAVIVELGAGLSTRYYRITNADDAYWVELDLPDAIAVRRQFDLETEKHRFIATSLLDFEWMDAIPTVSPENVLFLAEGVLFFVPESGVRQLIANMNRRFPGATFAFDVVRTFNRDRMQESFTRMDAPVQWAAESEDDVPAMGLQVLNTWYLLLEQPHRWTQIGVPESARRADRSVFLVETRLSG